MKRRLLIIAILLLLGAVVNVAVAWGCGEWSYRILGQYGSSSRLPSDADWRRAVPPNWPQPDHRATASGVGMTSAILSANDHRGHYAQLICQWGWPLRCLKSEGHASAQTRGSTTFPTDLRVMFIGSRTPGVILGPLKPIAPANGLLLMRPIWPGFAINTIFYTTLLWLLIPGPFALRRYLRLRRGFCPKCAYPMGEAAVCTECGRPLPSLT